MYRLSSWLLTFIGVCVLTISSAHINPKIHKKERSQNPTTQNSAIDFRENCDNAVSRIDMEVNNVRARLLTGGDVWWDGTNGRYIIPKVPAGVDEVSSIFAGAVWLGGKDPGGNFKVAAQMYGRSSGDFDYWPGPLTPDGDDQGTTTQERCAEWDRFFVVTGEEIQLHLSQFKAAQEAGIAYDPSTIPEGVLGWPARGNPYFFDVHKFDLPNTAQGLAGFWDENSDLEYDPTQGDYPIIEIRGCDAPQFPDEMTFWIYNDAGNTHAQSDGLPIRMEVQVQAFAYQTNDEVNNMTFQRYKLINRAKEDIDSTFFAMWVDPDLGCYADDYIGCDVERSMAFVYNEDALDGINGTTCDAGVNTYGDEVPLLGVDYFRGPNDEFGNELGMSSFTYFNNGGVTPTPPQGTTDPTTVTQYYFYLSGRWRDGSRYTVGGDGYNNPGAEITAYAFPDNPADPNGNSMCTETLPPGDRRTVQASGPFKLEPGAVNELIIGVAWVPNQTYPCPDISELQDADDIAQNLFDECFKLTRGPDAPFVDFIELDREIIAVLSNDTTGIWNNPYESYAETVLRRPQGIEDSLYRFEGYKVYQLSGPDVSLAQRDDPSKVRLVEQVDIKNGISRIFNWNKLRPGEETPTALDFFVPELQVEGADAGLRHTFRITEDQFADGDSKLINHRKYYYVVVAYAFNEYEAFNPNSQNGQREPYLEGDRNIGERGIGFYTVIPRPIVDRKLRAVYGEGPEVTRVDGLGSGPTLVDLSTDTRLAMQDAFSKNEEYTGDMTYAAGEGPIQVQIFNPLDVQDGEYELSFTDTDINDNVLSEGARWVLRSLSNPGAGEVAAARTIEELNEQVIARFGFSITVGQVPEPGTVGFKFSGNGVIGYEEEYLDEMPTRWLSGVVDDTDLGVFPALDQTVYNFMETGTAQVDESLDPAQDFKRTQYFLPYYLADWRAKENNQPYISPAWSTSNDANSLIVDRAKADKGLQRLNNVDIVFTPNKALWSRCVIVETASEWYQNNGLLPVGNRKSFDLRASPSVGKDADPNTGLPMADGDGEGMGWFPGYAVDVETGQRLNIFFGENSSYNGTLLPDLNNGADMMYNPSSELFRFPVDQTEFFSLYNYVTGGQHFIYVTEAPYDGCEFIRTRLRQSPSTLLKNRAMDQITWAGVVTAAPGTAMLSYEEGLIPSEVIVKLRVNNPFQVERDYFPNDDADIIPTGTGENNFHPMYRFKIEGKQAEELAGEEIPAQLKDVNVVPNPYYGFSDYENSAIDNIIKITNLPAKCIVTIYSLDGRFIRQYNRDEQVGNPTGYGTEGTQILPNLEWDLKNAKGIPVASGVYLIHVAAEGVGERTLKWFGINRKFDPAAFQ
ncbi:MAG: hypothetical protein HRU41_03290 [Saprospiraceae bacterium]|nr:hypothetical protein [Saprospiraceae bacterium]